MPKPTLLSLPAETRINILSNLPTREIVQMRKVCRDFKELIDVPSNQDALIKEIEDRTLNRLNYEYSTIILLDTSTTSFLTALADHVAHRGIVLRWGAYDVDYLANETAQFGTHWVEKHPTPPWLRRQTRSNVWDRGYGTGRLAAALLLLHVWCNAPEQRARTPFVSVEQWNFVEMYKSRAWQAGLGDQWMDGHWMRTVHKVISQQGGGPLKELKVTVVDSPKSPGRITQDYPPELDNNGKPDKEGFVEDSWLVETFGVPDLSGAENNGYRVTTEWAFERLRAAAVVEASVDPWEKAALMEELYIQ